MAVDFKDFERRMNKALDHLDEEFGAVRAGRANPKVLDRITVEYYAREDLERIYELAMRHDAGV